MNKTPILSLLFALLTISVANPLLTSCDDDDESKVYILEKEIEAGLLADNSVVIDTTCVTATIQGKMLHEEKLNDILDLSAAEVGIQYIKEADFLANANGQPYWHSLYRDETTISDFKFQLSFLEPGTSYLYRIYFTTSNFTLYGEVKKFTTLPLERYLNPEVVEQGFLSMKFAGINRLDDIFEEYSEKDIKLRIYIEYPSYYNDFNPTLKGDSMYFSLTKNFSAGHTYKYQLIASGKAKSGFWETLRSPIMTFSTRNPAEYIYLNEPSEISSTSAIISGQVDPSVFVAFSKNELNLATVYYGTDINHLSNIESCWTRTNEFEMTLKNLQPATTYYYKVRARWDTSYFSESLTYVDDFYTEIHSFTTK